MFSNERTLNPQVFIDAAVFYGFTYEFAESKIESYLENRSEDATVESFISWLKANLKESA